MDITQDNFLGGQVRITQPRDGYRAGIDPVMLAAAVSAKAGEAVLELGCGVGVASLCLGRRIPGLRLVGIELQPEYAALARDNAHLNEVAFEVHTGDLCDLPVALKSTNFDHVIMNPPYFDRNASVAAQNQGRETALGEGTPLADWMSVGAKRLKPKGTFSMIIRTERLPDVMRNFPNSIGSLQLFPIQARVGRASDLFILKARKSGRAAFRLEAPIVMHDGTQHVQDGESYSAPIQAVLRHGAALPIPKS